MIVNKFGGASIKDAGAIINMASICKANIQSGVIVVSAMGKTTNHLEKIAEAYFSGFTVDVLIEELATYFNSILSELFSDGHPVFEKINDFITRLKSLTKNKPGLNYDFEYDKIVSFGELISSQIIADYLNKIDYPVILVDIRESLKTDSTFREGKINWELAADLVPQTFGYFNKKVYLTQGFIGCDINNQTTTLGREGSDYTAAVLANILNAEKVVVWKDVPGVLCADPKWMPDQPKLDYISYSEAIELTYFGAQVIHPKTIKPLQNKNIPLQVRSFMQPQLEGTIISTEIEQQLPPVYIKKGNQILISIKPIDYSFIVEENLSQIFWIFAINQVKVNIMQNSAISFTVAVDGETDRVKNAIRELKKHYSVKYNDNLELISIRHYSANSEAKVLIKKEILLEQRSRSMVRFVVREKVIG